MLPGTSRLNVVIPSSDGVNPIGLTVTNNYTGTATKYGIDVNVDGAGSGTKYGISSSVIGLALDASPLYGYQVAMTPNGTGTTYGLFHSSTNAGTGVRYGLYSSTILSSSNASTGYGIHNYAQKQSGSSGLLYGYIGTVFNDGSGDSYGLYVNNNGFTTGQRFGVYMTGETDNFFSGNVGIGTASPAYQLHLTTNSAGKPTSNVWTVISDGRLKKNVRAYESGLEDLMKIRPVWFEYTGEAGMPREEGVGVIAQELQQVAPYMVSEWNYKPTSKVGRDGEPSQQETGPGTKYLGVNNGPMLYMMINAIKEQQAQIDQLKLQLQQQQETINALKAK